MSRARSISLLLSLAVLVFVTGPTVPLAHGQTAASTAGSSGLVSDPSGARVANADVTLHSPEKGITRVFKTDAEGNFSFALLPAGTYTLTIEAKGFKTLKQPGITLEVGQSATQSLTLTIGETTQIVVTTEAPLLQTNDANVGAEVSSKQIAELPINLRNVFNFVELNSSVNNASQRQTISSGDSKAPLTRTSPSLTLAAATLEQRHSSWMAFGMRARGGAALSTFHLLTTRRSSKFNRTLSPRNTAGVPEM